MSKISEAGIREGGTYQPRKEKRLIQHFEPGSSTAAPLNVTYRLGKIHDLGLLKGEWLDCGCADGGYTVAMVGLGAEKAVGVDPLEERIAEACKRDHPAVSFLQSSAETLPFSEGSFDGVLLNEVLEHVMDEIQTLREIHRVLRPGGHLVVMSPNRWFPFEGHGMHIGKRKFGYPMPLLPWLPERIGQQFMYARNYWPHELRELVRNAGFVIRDMSFVWPVFEVHPWLPQPIIRRYQTVLPTIDKIPFLCRFGVSVFVVAQKQF